jgi:5-methylcytosine-specific restriction endonuclease McrA
MASSPRFEITLYNRRPTDDELLADLRRVAKGCGRRPFTFGVYGSRGAYSTNTIGHRFGSWRAAMKAAGLPVHIDRDVPALALLENLMKVWRTLGRQPTTRELVKRDGVSRYALAAYERCFGSWHKALLALRCHVNGKRLKLPAAPARRKKERRRRSARHDLRRITARLRSRVLIRDCSTCRLCGTNPLKDPTITLHVDHIVPWSKGGRTVLANLQTLCARCNLGKGDQRFSSRSRSAS